MYSVRQCHKLGLETGVRKLTRAPLTDHLHSPICFFTIFSNDWSRVQPSTNVFWLRYLVDKLLRAVAYEHKSQRSHRASLTRLEQRLKKRVYDSVWALVQNDELFADVRTPPS